MIFFGAFILVTAYGSYRTFREGRSVEYDCPPHMWSVEVTSGNTVCMTCNKNVMKV